MTANAGLLGFIAALLERAGIPYMVAGSFASTFYASPRTTADIDIVIDTDAAGLDRLLAGLDPPRFFVDSDTARDASVVGASSTSSTWRAAGRSTS